MNFSFSGIKTAFLYFLRDQKKQDEQFLEKNLTDVCASIQATLVEILLKKLRKAIRETGITEVAIAGGVSANSGLRKTLTEEGQKKGWNIYIPKFEYCTDNAAMIAAAAYIKYQKGILTEQDSSPDTRMSLSY